MDGRPNWINKAAFSNSSGVKQMEPRINNGLMNQEL